MIIDLAKFLVAERPFWTELEQALDRLEADPGRRPALAEAQRLHYLYERASADLGKIMTFTAEPEMRRYLESLVARAYGEIHSTSEPARQWSPRRWLLETFPQTFRRQVGAFYLALAVTIAGTLFGGVAVMVDPDAKAVAIPYSGLHGDPSERVAHEEHAKTDPVRGMKARGTAFYIQNNTRVAFTTLALGITWGIGTLVVLFYNGIMLGAVAVDYIQAGHSKFLVGWLLPHGSFEIPAILIAGQAGLLLGRGLIGWGERSRVTQRLQQLVPDLVTLIGGVTLMLLWAALVEAWFSQYHEPILPYWIKITFGSVELTLLTAYLALAGRRTP